VLASGRFHTPAIPNVPGLHEFAGTAGAVSRFAREAAAFGAITSNEMTDRERGYRSLLAPSSLN
jgi:hypothetical protein